MNKILLAVTFLTFLSFACSREYFKEKDLSYEYFKQHLTSDMNYMSIVETFGKPEKDIGSGIHIYVYELDDATEMWIGYTDSILYAKQVNRNQQVLRILIDRSM